MENEFAKVMAERTDKELVAIVTVDIQKYQLLALEAANAEIRARNIDMEKFTQIQETIAIDNMVQAKLDAGMVSSGERFVHHVVDTIAFVIVFFILAGIQAMFGMVGIADEISFWFVLLGSFFLYYGVMEYNFQKTLGKFITKTKVVTALGEKPTKDDIVRRTACRLIPFDRLSFLFAKSGFHDSISKTIVVRDHKI
jgi:hypothetical protein